MKKISIAMITYNHEKFIEQAIRSIMMQKGNFQLEIIIGNDCSKDDTANIIKKLIKEFPNTINFIDRKKNIGIINNLVDVLSYCNGDYIAILEGDDYWLTKTKLQKQLDFLENNKDYSAVGHDALVINQFDEFINKNNPLVNFHKNYSRPKEFFMYNFCPTLSIMYRNDKKIHNQLKNIWKNVDMVADYSLKAYLTTLGKVRILDEKLGVYRYVVKGGSSYSSMGYKGLVRGYNDVIESLINLLKLKVNYKYNSDIKSEIRRKRIVYMLIYIKFFKFKDLLEYIRKLKSDVGILRLISYIILMPLEATRYMLLNLFLKVKSRNERRRNGK